MYINPKDNISDIPIITVRNFLKRYSNDDVHTSKHVSPPPADPQPHPTENEMIDEKIQRNFFEVADLHDPDDSDYWHHRSWVERIEAIEFMRKAMFGHDRVSERLQRVLTITELKEN